MYSLSPTSCPSSAGCHTCRLREATRPSKAVGFLSGISESMRLAGILGFVYLESSLRTILTLVYALFPFKSALDLLYRKASFLQQLFSKRFEGPFSCQQDSVELLHELGYKCDECPCVTEDGFHLVLHRIRGNNTTMLNDRPPVLLLHGLLMSDEVFLLSKSSSIAIYLYEAGYDVWLGNNRGNKYSWRHNEYLRDDQQYWDFSIDHMARFDIPTMINTVLTATGHAKLAFIGFSNGTAQMFAALSNNASSSLVDKVSVFVALAPACRIVDLNPSSVALKWFYPLIGSSQRLFGWLFGHQAFLQVTLTWQRILSPSMFTALILWCLKALFSWDCHSIREPTLSKLFGHIYSTTSTKTVHHWFRMLHSKRFESYPDPSADRDPAVSVPVYRIDRIGIPVHLFCGGRDRLSDIQWIQQTVPDCTSHLVPHYEHLDFLAAHDLPKTTFGPVRTVLEKYMSKSDSTQESLSPSAVTTNSRQSGTELQYG